MEALWSNGSFTFLNIAELLYNLQVLVKMPFSVYHIYLAIRRGVYSSRMTSNNKISPMEFCYNTNFTLPKQSQGSRSILQDGSRYLGLLSKEKELHLITVEIW